MIKMDLPVPMVALTLFAKRDHFTLVQDSLQVPLVYQSYQIKLIQNGFIAVSHKRLPESCEKR